MLTCLGICLILSSSSSSPPPLPHQPPPPPSRRRPRPRGPFPPPPSPPPYSSWSFEAPGERAMSDVRSGTTSDELRPPLLPLSPSVLKASTSRRLKPSPPLRFTVAVAGAVAALRRLAVREDLATRGDARDARPYWTAMIALRLAQDSRALKSWSRVLFSAQGPRSCAPDPRSSEAAGARFNYRSGTSGTKLTILYDKAPARRPSTSTPRTGFLSPAS